MLRQHQTSNRNSERSSEASHQTTSLPRGTQPFLSQCHTSREVNIFLTKVNIWWTRFWCLLTRREVCVCGLHGPLQLVWQFIIWKLLHCYSHSGPQLLCLVKSNKDQCYAKIFGHDWQIQITGLIWTLVVYDKIEYLSFSIISKIHNGGPGKISYCSVYLISSTIISWKIWVPVLSYWEIGVPCSFVISWPCGAWTLSLMRNDRQIVWNLCL